MADLVEVGSFCPNPKCPDFGKIPPNQITKYGKSRQGKQRYQCLCCTQSFNENHGTLFYRKRTPQKEILETLALLAEGARISRLSRAKGLKEDTILSWRREAATPAEAVEVVRLQSYQVGPSQIDGLWSYGGHKGSKKTLRKPKRKGRSGAPP